MLFINSIVDLRTSCTPIPFDNNNNDDDDDDDDHVNNNNNTL